ELKGVSQPVEIHQVLHESAARSRLEAAASHGLTPFTGRAVERDILLSAWREARAGRGSTIALVGEAGIGKSMLLHVLKEQTAAEPDAWMTELRSSAYHQNSAFYPVIDLLER